jgi:DNA-binding CsgD family transcriptional regulator
LQHLVQAVQSHRGVLIAGEAGVGKTRLAAEMLALAHDDGWSTVALVVGTASANIPFAPFAPLLAEAGVGDGVDRFVRASRALASRGDRVLVGIDDAHLLDDVSLAFVRHLLATPAGPRLLLTARSGVPMPETLASAWKSGAVLRVELRPLDRSDVERLVIAGLGGPVDLATTHWLWRTSGGNPLYLRELVLDALGTGGIELRRGRWTLTPSPTRPGSRLLEVVAPSVGAAGEPHREALELLAVGEPLGLDLLEDLVGPELVQTLERRDLISTRRDGQRTTARCAHPMHGEVLRSALGASTARAHRRRLIEALVATGASRTGDSIRLALWRCEVGDTTDWSALLDAARELSRPRFELATEELLGDQFVATGQNHVAAALRLARAGYGSGGTIEGALLVHALLLRLGRVAEADELDGALDARVLTDADRVSVARARARAALFHDGDVGRALDGLQALVSGSSDPQVHAATLAPIAQLHIFTRRHLTESIEVGLAAGSDRLAPRVDQLAGPAAAAVALAELGQTARAVEVLEHVAEAAHPGDDPVVLAALRGTRVTVLTTAGRYREAERLAADTQEVATSAGDDEVAGVAASLLAQVQLAQGRAASAAASAAAAVERLADIDILGARRAALVTAVAAHSLRGEVSAASARLDELKRQVRPQRWADDDEVLARAWLDVATGRSSAAVGRIQAAAERAAVEGRPARELVLLHAIARLGNAHAVAARVVELAPLVDGATSDAVLAFVLGASDRDATRLAAAGAAFGDAGARLLEAESFAQASVVLAAAGMRAAAASAAARSRAAAERCEGASTPAMVLGGAVQVLTKREREIADLASRGLSDRQIADTLVVSPRTVQTHLYNAYAKLGIDGRTGLRAVLRP